MKTAVGILVTLLLTLGLWSFHYKTFPIFVAEEALKKSSEIGVLTPELEVEVRAEDFKSSMVIYVLWGMVVGLVGAIAPGLRDSKLPVRIAAGLVLGALAGVATNFISERYALRSEPPLDPVQYWVIRIFLTHALLVAVAAIVANIGHPASEITSRLVKVELALIFAACIFSFLMGLVTPIEQAQYHFPKFPANNGSLLFSVNFLLFLSLGLGGNRVGGVKEAGKKSDDKVQS